MPSYKIKDLTVPKIKELLSKRNLDSTGIKATLVSRLIEAVGEETIEVEENTLDADDNVTAMQSQLEALTALVQKLQQTIDSQQVQQSVTHVSKPVIGHEVSDNDFRNDLCTSPSANARQTMLNGTTMTDAMSPYEIRGFMVNPSTPSIRDIVLPEFDPTSDSSISVENFVDRTNSLIGIYKWEEKALMLAAHMKLKGQAKLWVDSSVAFRTWQEFSTKLIDEFSRTLNEADIHTKMSECVRKPGERIVDYCFKVNALGQRYRLSEAAIISYARRGLKHSELQTAVAGFAFASMREMREFIERYLNNRPLSTRNESRKTPQPNTSTAKETISTSTDNVEQRHRGIVCYNCREIGHVSANCSRPPRKQRCSNCMKTSHSTKECPEVKVNVKCIEANARTPDKMTKEVFVNNQKMLAFIDPGSARSLIQESVARNFNGVEKCERVTLKGFAGGNFVAEETVRVKLCIDDMTFNVDLLLIDDDVLQDTLLLGRNFICSDDHRLIIENGMCRIECLTPQKVTVGKNLSDRGKLDDVISRYSDCFSENIKTLGKCNTTTVSIELLSDKIIARKPYRIPYAKRRSTSMGGKRKSYVKSEDEDYKKGKRKEEREYDDVKEIKTKKKGKKTKDDDDDVDDKKKKKRKKGKDDDEDYEDRKKPNEWDKHLRNLQWSINTSRNSTTGFTPNDLVFDFKLKDIITNRVMQAINDDYEDDFASKTDMSKRRQQAAENINKARERWKRRFDMKHKTPHEYEVDDLVVVENVPAATGESKKLEPSYKGPYVIKKVLRFDRYLIEDIEGAQRNQRRFSSVFASDKLKPWCALSPELDPGDDEDIDNEEIRDDFKSGWPSCHMAAQIEK